MRLVFPKKIAEYAGEKESPEIYHSQSSSRLEDPIPAGPCGMVRSSNTSLVHPMDSSMDSSLHSDTTR